MSGWRRDLERRLRAARPDEVADRDAPPTDHELDVLARVMSDEAPPASAATPARSTWPSRVPVLVAAGIVVVALAVTAVVFGRPKPAFAATPPPLVTTPIAQTAPEVLNAAADAMPSRTDSGHTIAFHTWALNSEPDEHGVLASVVEPFVVTLSRDPGGGVTRTWRTGEPWPQNAAGPAPAGQLVSTEVFAPGEYMEVFTEPPADPHSYGRFFAETGYLPEQPAAGDYLQLVMMLLNERSLSSDQESALLRFLAGLPDLKVDGQVTDRLGRAGVKLSAVSPVPGDFIPSLIASVAGQGVLSYESTYIGTNRTDIASPSVVVYSAWET